MRTTLDPSHWHLGCFCRVGKKGTAIGGRVGNLTRCIFQLVCVNSGCMRANTVSCVMLIVLLTTVDHYYEHAHKDTEWLAQVAQGTSIHFTTEVYNQRFSCTAATQNLCTTYYVTPNTP